MQEFNNFELKEKIHSYLQLPEKIDDLKLRKQLFSKNFYATRSMTGTMPVGILEAQDYTRAVTPEFGTLLILDCEAIIQNRIDRASKMWQLFNELMPFLEPDRLLIDRRLHYVTIMESQVLEAINEVEFYLAEHDKVKRKEEIETLAENKTVKDEGAKLLDKLAAWDL